MSMWRCEREGSGALRDLVTVEKLLADAATNELGEIDQADDGNWEQQCQAWAEIQLAGGDEVQQPSQQAGIREWRLRVRYNAETATITPLMRVQLPEGGVLFVTWSGDPDRMRRWIEIVAKEQTT